MRATATIIPTMRYRDAPGAIAWLCDAFGFEKHLVVPGEDGTIAHAQLTRGNSMIMLGSINDSQFGQLMRQPEEIGGGATQSIYVVIPDIDAHYAHAKAAGAEIVIDLAAQDYGGKLYTCRDPEGHVWNFGSYDPWTEPAG
ncbi:VOC family protein [Vineibacter terrae]|uniref:VOC family protein n=1 Tax=Vineibacter terrae TaxID=2586908 RepID=UPI002E30589C|nr:VOC family protein [Vineibacter terrae]HEX2891590.1 VOC family protein [Vineibacter terrae]